MENLQTHNCHRLCCSTQTESHGCKDAVLPEPFTKSHTVKCVAYEENTTKLYNGNLCFFRALVLHFWENGGLEEEASKMFTFFLENIGGTNPASFQGFCTKNVPILEDLKHVYICLYDINFADETKIREMPEEVLENIPTLFDYYVTTVIFVVSLISMYSSMLIAAQRVILSSTEHQNWSVI